MARGNTPPPDGGAGPNEPEVAPDGGAARQRDLLAQFQDAIAGMRTREIQTGLRELRLPLANPGGRGVRPGRAPDLAPGQLAPGRRCGVGFPRIGRQQNPYPARLARRLVIEWTTQL
jgi:hypothetical protein